MTFQSSQRLNFKFFLLGLSNYTVIAEKQKPNYTFSSQYKQGSCLAKFGAKYQSYSTINPPPPPLEI